MTRPIFEIARDIQNDWKNVSPYARPYLNAMHSLTSVNDKYILDSGRSVLLYFLSNAQGWRGEKARAVKKEINDIIKHF